VAIFLTGSTGYIGAHVAANLLDTHGASLNLLVRGKDARDAELRLWRAMQLHMEFPRFYEYLQTNIRMFLGDLTAPLCGLSRDDYDRLVHTTDSVIHCAASLNRKSEKSCLNVNLRGTLEVIQLARRSQYYHGLRRFSNVSTVAVAGKRCNDVVTEDQSILRAHGARVASRYARHCLSPQHRSRRQPVPADHTVRHGRVLCLPGGIAHAAFSA
jgi:thioester reductase-like protein